MAEPAERLLERKQTRLFSMAHQREGFAKGFDGTKISYRSQGSGDPPIVCCNGLGVSTFFWVYFEKQFVSRHQVVTWDYRGHGRSGVKEDPKSYTLASLVRDLRVVIRTLKVQKPILIGHSLGTQVILEYYRRYPREVAALIPCFGTYGHPMDTFYNLSFSPLIFRLVYFLGTQFPRQGNLISRFFLSNRLSYWVGGILKVMNTGMMDREAANRYVSHILSVDPRLFTGLLKSAQETSCEDMLKTIRVPTLIVGGDIDQFTPSWISKKMHRLIPESELFMMHKASHAGLVEQPDLFNLRIEKFIRERVRLFGKR